MTDTMKEAMDMMKRLGFSLYMRVGSARVWRLPLGKVSDTSEYLYVASKDGLKWACAYGMNPYDGDAAGHASSLCEREGMPLAELMGDVVLPHVDVVRGVLKDTACRIREVLGIPAGWRAATGGDRCTECSHCTMDLNGAYCERHDGFVDQGHVCDDFERSGGDDMQ